nr:MFS transporter [Pseudogymnoascus verrucosus]
MVYFLPIWFQAIHGDDPIMSAVHMLPLILSQVAGVLIAGSMTIKIGYYMPFVWACVVLMPVGIGLMTTFYVGIPYGRWIGYQIIFGLGVGFGFQQVNIAAQFSLPFRGIPTGVALVFSAQFLGGAVFVSVAENVFNSRLRSNIVALQILGLDPAVMVKVGATELRNVVSPSQLHVVLLAYNDAITKAFQISLITSCLTILGASGMEWRSTKRKTGS